MSIGSVALVGAGPGDPGLITVRGHALLRSADVVVHDRLVAPDLLRSARPDAELVNVGKRPRDRIATQQEINELLVARALAGKTVVRLKGGDPYLFGRGGEEALALAQAGIPFEVVPGVTSAFAVPAAAGIPVTHRGLASSVAVATAHDASATAAIDWEAMARADTAVFLMGIERITEVVARLLEAGAAPDTPAAVVQSGTLPSMRTVRAPLRAIADAATRANLQAPAVIVVGPTVQLRDHLGGWDTRLLSGVRVLVTRTREQAGELTAILRELGASVTEAPAIAIKPARSTAALDEAVANLRDGAFAWVVLTSVNGVRALASRLRAAGLDARALASARIAAVGPGTADALGQMGITADLVPASFTTEAIGQAFPSGSGVVLLWRADLVEPGLEDAIQAKGWTTRRVEAYRLTGTSKIDPDIKADILGGGFDVLTFASGGTVRAFMKLLGDAHVGPAKVVCIGPVTAKAAEEAGLKVAAVANPHTIPGLAAAVAEAVTTQARSTG
jgi:uroporphyrinogen III methyltransferase / synthase